MTKIIFKLLETKKHSGKYVQESTENDMYPNQMYFRKEWFKDQKLPAKVQMTIEEAQ